MSTIDYRLSHDDALLKLNNLNNFAKFKKDVFNLYSNLFDNCGNYNVTNFLRLISNYDCFLIKIELDFNLLTKEFKSIPEDYLNSICKYNEEIFYILESQILELQKLHRMITSSTSYLRIYRTNSKIDRLREQFNSEIKILGSRMRFCLQLLNNQP